MYEGNGPVLTTVAELNALPALSVVLFELPTDLVEREFHISCHGFVGVGGQKDGDGKWYLADGEDSSWAEDLAGAAGEHGLEFKARVLWVPEIV